MNYSANFFVLQDLWVQYPHSKFHIMAVEFNNCQKNTPILDFYIFKEIQWKPGLFAIIIFQTFLKNSRNHQAEINAQKMNFETIKNKLGL